MNESLIVTMREYIETLNGVDLSPFDEREKKWIRESLEEIKALCRNYALVEIGLLGND